jgi:hypothetical protein
LEQHADADSENNFSGTFWRFWQLFLPILSIFYFDEPMLAFEEVVKEKKLLNFSYVPLELATYYSAFDAFDVRFGTPECVA